MKIIFEMSKIYIIKKKYKCSRLTESEPPGKRATAQGELKLAMSVQKIFV